MSNVCIVYSSTHHGNTEKVLYKIKEKYPETVLIKAVDFNPDDFKRYDTVLPPEFFTLNLRNRSIHYLNKRLRAAYKSCFLFTPLERLMQGLKKCSVKEPNKTERSVWVYSAVKVSIPSAP